MAALPEEADHPPLLLVQVELLGAYAARHGPAWKERLWLEWANATADPVLHRLRNSHGPAWLSKYSPPDG